MSLLDYRAKPFSWRNKPFGTRVGGRVVEDGKEVQCRDFDTNELLFWDDGNKQMQLVVTVDTGVIDDDVEDDDGLRAIFIKGQMLAETRKACRKARVREIKEGGQYWVTLVSEEPLPKGKKGNPKKLYEVEYEPPVARDDDDGDDEPPARETGAQAATRVGRDPQHHANLRAVTGGAPRSRPAQDDQPPF